MNYKEIKGDLIQLAKEGHFDIICHGANCLSVMGAGIAAQIAKEFPIAAAVDRLDFTPTKHGKLGNFTVGIHHYPYGSNRIPLEIVNLYTQYEPGPNLDYEALILCLRKINRLCKDQNRKIGLPQIGCGIAGGDWERVKAIIQQELTDVDYTVVIYEP